MFLQLCFAQLILISSVAQLRLQPNERWSDDFMFDPNGRAGWNVTKISGYSLPANQSNAVITVANGKQKYHGPYPSSYRLQRVVICDGARDSHLFVTHLSSYCNTDRQHDSIRFTLSDPSQQSVVVSGQYNLNDERLPLQAEDVPFVVNKTEELFTNDSSPSPVVPECGSGRANQEANLWFTHSASLGGRISPGFMTYNTKKDEPIEGNKEYLISFDMALSSAALDEFVILEGIVLICSPAPTASPTAPPTDDTKAPSLSPSAPPSRAPSVSPSASPSLSPSVSPSSTPSQAPTLVPSMTPTHFPSQPPTASPTTSTEVAAEEEEGEVQETTQDGSIERTKIIYIEELIGLRFGALFWLIFAAVLFCLLCICCIVFYAFCRWRKRTKRKETTEIETMRTMTLTAKKRRDDGTPEEQRTIKQAEHELEDTEETATHTIHTTHTVDTTPTTITTKEMEEVCEMEMVICPVTSTNHKAHTLHRTQGHDAETLQCQHHLILNTNVDDDNDDDDDRDAEDESEIGGEEQCMVGEGMQINNETEDSESMEAEELYGRQADDGDGGVADGYVTARRQTAHWDHSG